MPILYHNCRLFTPDDAHPDTFFTVNGEKVGKRGKNVNLSDFSNYEKVDLKGALVTPGIGDAHVHVSE